MARKQRNGRSVLSMNMKRRDSLCGLFFVSLFIIGLVMIYLPANATSLRYSVSKVDANFNTTFVGLANFHDLLFKDPTYFRQMLESLGSTLLTTGIIIIYALFVSSLLNKNLPGRALFRALLFLPVVTSAGIIGVVQGFDASSALGGQIGESGNQLIAGGLFSDFALEEYIVALNLSPGLSNVVVGVINNFYDIITRSGVQLVIFLAGLQTISPAVYESAYVEGATGWETFWKITLPCISPLIIVNVVYTFIDSFTNPNNEVMNRILNNIVQDINYDIAAAMAWIYFAVIGVMLVVILAILSRFTFYEDR